MRALSLFTLLATASLWLSGHLRAQESKPKSLIDYWSTCPDFLSEQKDLVISALQKSEVHETPLHLYEDLELLYANRQQIQLRTSTLGTWAMQILPAAKGGYILAVIETVLEPTPDSQIHFYTTQWEALPREHFITPPRAQDFIKLGNAPEHLANLLKPLHSTSSFESNGDLTIRLSLPPLLNDAERQEQEKALSALPPIHYRWGQNRWRPLEYKANKTKAPKG